MVAGAVGLRIGREPCHRVGYCALTVLVYDAKRQVAVPVVVAGGPLVGAAGPDQLNRMLCGATEYADGCRVVRELAAALADHAVARCPAGQERRWRWVQGREDRRVGEGRRG